MRTPAAALVLVLLALPAAAAGASTYVHVVVAPDFQYRSDRDVVVDLAAVFVNQNVPRPDLVRIEVLDERGKAFPIVNGEDLQAGIRPYPQKAEIHFGRLEPGAYDLKVVAKAGGQQKSANLALSVVLPPVPYTAAMLGSGEAKHFSFQASAPEANRTFTITVYRLGTGGPVKLAQVVTNDTADVEVPYVAGQATYVDVEDPNHWVNHEHGGNPWVSFPDYRSLDEVEDTGWARIITAALLVAGFGAALWFGVRRLGGARHA